MNLMRILRLLLRLFGDARAISRGRGGQRLMRRGARRAMRQSQRAMRRGGTGAHGAQDQHPD